MDAGKRNEEGSNSSYKELKYGKKINVIMQALPEGRRKTLPERGQVHCG
jgi:hypothetical protein